MVNKTREAKLMERERIAAVMKVAVLSVCREKYKNAIEVDALICVAVTATDHHVVKIHETLGKFGNGIPGLPSSQNPYGDDGICKVSNIWSMGPKSKRKRRKVVSESAATSQPATNTTGFRGKENAENMPEASANDSGSETLKNGTSVNKYPYLVQTLCGEDKMYLSTVNKDGVMKCGLDNSPPVPIPVPPKEPASVASILSGLMIPMGAAATPQQSLSPAAPQPVKSDSTPVPETTVRRKRKLDPGEIRRASPVTQEDNDGDEEESEEYTSIKDEDKSLDEYSETVSNPTMNFDENNSNRTDSEASPSPMVIKEEPQWDAPEEAEPVWPLKKSEVDSSNEAEEGQDQSNCEPTPTQYSSTEQESSDDPLAMSVTRIKEEPPDSDHGEPEMEIDTDVDAAQLDSNKNSQSDSPSSSISESTKNSILLKILKGKSLAEAYKSSVPRGKISSPGDSDKPASQTSGSEEQDNSLVYRLPFVSFQDLFPGDVSGDKNQERDDVAVTSSPETSMRVGAALTPSEHASRKFELLTKSLLEKRNRMNKGPYSTRLSSGRKNPVNYTEMADMGSDLDQSDDSGSPRSEIDDSYSPRLEGMLDDDGYSGRRKKGTPQNSGFSKHGQKAGMWDNLESDIAFAYEKVKEMGRSSGSSNSPQSQATPKQSTLSNLMLFACSICGSEFSSRAERDRHEEEEQYSEFVKCPLCNGYFGDEMSKRKHMRERHRVCETEVNSKGTGTGNSSELRALEVPKRSEGMLTYHTTQCPICYNFFYSEAERDEHLSKEHQVTPVTQ